VHRFLLVGVAIAISRHTFTQRAKQVLSLRAPSPWHPLITLALVLPLLITFTKLLDWLSLLEAPTASLVASSLSADNPRSFQYVNAVLMTLADHSHYR
jgi:hypothetical protein